MNFNIEQVYEKKLNVSEHFVRNSSDKDGITLCIPFVFKHITKKRVFAVFRAQKVGHIERIDIVSKDEKHNRVYVHFAPGRWNMRHQDSIDVLLNMKASIPWIVPYSHTGYWKVWISNSAKPELNAEAQIVPRVKRRETVDLSPRPSTNVLRVNTVMLDLNDPIQARISASSPSPSH